MGKLQNALPQSQALRLQGLDEAAVSVAVSTFAFVDALSSFELSSAFTVSVPQLGFDQFRFGQSKKMNS